MALRAALVATLSWLTASTISAQQPSLDSLSIEELTNVRVQTAALRSQPISDAPAAVSIVTADQIRSYGYRTLGEVLNHVRGIFMTSDRTYSEAGIGGFSIPGDWSTRTLVLINGHPMTDNIFGSASYFEEDFPLDMQLVDRVEIVRGPSSALYGSAGILATINILTRKPGDNPDTGVRLETGSLGVRKLTFTHEGKLGRKASMLLSGTVFNSSGQQDLHIPEFDTPESNNGHAIRMDGARGYRFFANLVAGNWQIMALAGSRDKIQPLSWGETIFNDRGTRAIDQRALVDALYTRETETTTLRWRTSYDSYRFKGQYHYPLEDGGVNVNREYDAGDWLGTQLTYRFPFAHGNLTAGTEFKVDLRALQSVADVEPVFVQNLLVDRRDRYAAGFLQQEWSFGAKWSLYAGARYDWSWYRNSAVAPRVALIYQPNKKTSLKFIYGRGFRDPNANELFFDDGRQYAGNPGLRPEQADNFEVAVYRTLGRDWLFSLSAYDAFDRQIIVPGYTADGLLQFVNDDQFHGIGVGAEVSGRISRFHVDANFQKQRAHLTGRVVPANSPGDVGKFRLLLPVARRASLSYGLLYQSERRSLAAERLPPVFLSEATLTARNVAAGFDFQTGVRNLFDCRYRDPIGLVSQVDSVLQPGRTLFVSLTWHTSSR